MNSDKYNNQRKKLLQELDKGRTPSIAELGMYDLTPYFKEKFDVSLSEAILLNKNSERRIDHLKDDFYLSPPQKKALDVLSENRRVIFSAPTSFGKTLLVKEFIFKYKPQNIVYIVPTNALAYELERSFKNNEKFSIYTIFDKCNNDEGVREKNEEKLLFIGTQEKFLEIESEKLGEIDLFVIDEAYKLQESVSNQRAYKLSETFLNSISRKSKKVFLLTPQAKFSGFEKYEFQLFETTFNAVEKNYIVLEPSEFFDILLEKGKSEKSILFCESPKQINTTYEALKHRLRTDNVTSFINMLETDIHPDWCVIKLLKAGILTHHGQMPKYVQNKMINMFNQHNEYNILLGTNSISEGINTITKNLFIHPDYHNSNNLLLKNTVGRAGRLGEYPMGYIYSTENINEIVESEIEIELSISNEEELAELEDSKDDNKILEFSNFHNLEFDFCRMILKKYKLSLLKLGKIITVLKTDCRYPGLTNLPYMSNRVFEKEYNTILDYDTILIRGFLQAYYTEDEEKISLNNFDDRIRYFKTQCNKKGKRELNSSEIINLYMQFIYSTLEYYIMPVVNIGLDVRENFSLWEFGENVITTLEDCKKKYYKKTFGSLDMENLSDSHVRIIGTLRDYGMTNIIKNLNMDILNEIESRLNIRYSTVDVLRAIEYLSQNSVKNRAFYIEVRNKYIN